MAGRSPAFIRIHPEVDALQVVSVQKWSLLASAKAAAMWKPQA